MKILREFIFRLNRDSSVNKMIPLPIDPWSKVDGFCTLLNGFASAILQVRDKALSMFPLQMFHDAEFYFLSIRNTDNIFKSKCLIHLMPMILHLVLMLCNAVVDILCKYIDETCRDEIIFLMKFRFTNSA